MAPEREFETMADEFYKTASMDMFNNMKRTYDEYLNAGLKVASDAQQSDNVRQNIANQALQNAVETANMVGKQAVRHGDIAIDRQWNIDEVSSLSAKTGLQQDAIAAIMVATVAETLNQMGIETKKKAK